jgi:hypothetical protein
MVTTLWKMSRFAAMMVLDHFALFVPRVFSQQSAAKDHPLGA